MIIGPRKDQPEKFTAMTITVSGGRAGGKTRLISRLVRHLLSEGLTVMLDEADVEMDEQAFLRLMDRPEPLVPSIVRIREIREGRQPTYQSHKY